MQARHLFITILAICVILLAPSAGLAITWNGQGNGVNWNDGRNWIGGNVPGPTDDVVIGECFTVEISADNAACKTLDIGSDTLLKITGKTLTLGDSNADTTSNLDSGGPSFPEATIRFVKGGSGSPGVLVLLRWVTFTGGGIIEARTNSDRGVIGRGNGLNDKGMIIPSGSTNELTLIGNINILCDFDHSNTNAFVGTDTNGQLMVFGKTGTGSSERVPDIKGVGTITTKGGTVRFTVVDFDQTTAPKWEIRDGTMNLTSQAVATAYLNEVFDIEMIKGSGTLDLDNSLATTGTFTVFPGVVQTVELALDVCFQVGAVTN